MFRINASLCGLAQYIHYSPRKGNISYLHWTHPVRLKSAADADPPPPTLSLWKVQVSVYVRTFEKVVQSRSESRRGGDCWCQTLCVNESERKTRRRNSHASWMEDEIFFFFFPSSKVEKEGGKRSRDRKSEGWGGGKLLRSRQISEVLTG